MGAEFARGAGRYVVLRLASWTGVLSIGLAAGMPALAAKLDVPSCKALLAQQARMKREGVGEAIARGPAWGRAHLDAAGLQRVRAYIALEEQILFRCPAGFRNAVVVAIKRQPDGARPIPPVPLKVAGALRPKLEVAVPAQPAPNAARAPVRPATAAIELPARNAWKGPAAAQPVRRAPEPPKVKPPVAPLPERKKSSALEGPARPVVGWRRQVFAYD